MTVAKMIEILQALPPDAPVFCYDSEGDEDAWCHIQDIALASEHLHACCYDDQGNDKRFPAGFEHRSVVKVVLI